MIVRASLPRGLEALRRRSVGDAASGVPAHLTMLYPFVAPERLDRSVRATIANVARTSEPFDYQLVERATWPDTVYARVEPVRPFVELQARLARAFPGFRIYGTDESFEFVPHVTIGEGAGLAAAGREHPVWRALPRPARAAALDVIGRDLDGRWRLIWRLPLGRGHDRAAARMRP